MDYGSFNTALKAAAGDNISLAEELRADFVESANRQISLLSRSRCDANWEYAAYRLKGLAASFGATAIIELTDEALEGAPGDPVVVRKLEGAVADILDHDLN